MANPSVVIDIAAEYTGNKAFNKAGKATTDLDKTVKKLAKSLGLAFSARAVLNYSKLAVNAAAADEKAQRQLALALKNVGLARESSSSEKFIQSLQKEFGVVDDLLRPAFQYLAIATKDAYQSQRLLKIALDISAATGKDLQSVTNALGKAYLGSNTALSKLGVGISKADLKTESFYDITEKLASTFAGAALESTKTFSGQLAKLAVTSDNVKEILGKGIIDSLTILAGNTSIDEFGTQLEFAATNAANLLVELTKIGKFLATPLDVTAKGLISFIDTLGPFVDLLATGEVGLFMAKQKSNKFKIPAAPRSKSPAGLYAADQAAKAAQKAAAAKSKADKAAAAAKIKSDKLSAANAAKLAKAAKLFDMDRIQITAALKGKISEEEKIRLQLQLALLDEDATKADQLAKKLKEVQDENAKIAKSLAEISAATNPFEAWVGSLTKASTLLAGIALFNADGSLTPKGKVNIPQGGDLPGGTSIFTPDMTATEIANAATAAADVATAAAETATASVLATEAVITAIAEAATAASKIATVITNVPTSVAVAGAGTSSSMFNPYAMTPGSSAGFGTSIPQVYVTVNNTGSVIMQDEFVDAVNRAMLSSILTGKGQLPAGYL